MLHPRTAPATGAGGIVFTLWRYVLPLAFTFLLASTANAGSTATTLTLPTALERTLALNPALKIYAFRKDALTGSAFSANLKPTYELGIEAENFGGSGDTQGFAKAELTVSLSSVIEMGEKRKARNAVVQGSFAMLDTQLRLQSLKLMADVTRHYIETLAAQTRVQLADEALALAEETVATMRKRTAAGASSEAEANRAQAAFFKAQLMKASAVQRFALQKMLLSSMWGAESPSFEALEGNLFEFGQDRSFELLYDTLRNNPAIELFTAKSRVNEAELRLAKAESKSDLNWSFGIRRFKEVNDTALVAGVSVPLFSARRNTGEVSRYLAQRNAISSERDNSLLQLRSTLFNAYSSRQNAIHAVKQLQTQIIPSLEKAVTQTREGYRAGRLGYLDYISVAQELLESRRMLIDTAAAVLTYGAELEELTAGSISAGQLDQHNAHSGVGK